MHIEASPRPVGDGGYEICVGGAWRGGGVDVVSAVGVGVHFPRGINWGVGERTSREMLGQMSEEKV